MADGGEPKDVDGLEKVRRDNIATGPSLYPHIFIDHADDAVIIVEVFCRKHHGQQLGCQHHNESENQNSVLVTALPPAAFAPKSKLIAHES